MTKKNQPKNSASICTQVILKDLTQAIQKIRGQLSEVHQEN